VSQAAVDLFVLLVGVNVFYILAHALRFPSPETSCAILTVVLLQIVIEQIGCFI
jgi:hypothetical protein